MDTGAATGDRVVADFELSFNCRPISSLTPIMHGTQVSLSIAEINAEAEEALQQMIPRSNQMIDEKDRQTLDDALVILKRAMNKEAAALITKDQVSPQGLIATEFAENLAKLQAGIEALEKRRG